MTNASSGVFNVTGQSGTVEGNAVDVLVDIPGTASVSLEVKLPDGTWQLAEAAYTADTSKMVERATPVAWRLNCGSITTTNKSIIGITNANPMVITATSHGFTQGDIIGIAGVEGMTEVNGRAFVVTAADTHTFTIGAVDSTNFGVFGAPRNITAATKANPVVVTSVAHGLSDGDSVKIAGVVGMTELNGNTYTVAGKTNDTFQLSGVNGTAYGAYGGTAKAVTNITKAAQAVVTSAGHGLSAGAKVKFADVVGLTGLNGNTYTILSATTDTFTINADTASMSGTYGSPATGPTAITKANPAVVTQVAHGLTNGMTVKFTGVPGMTQLEGNTYTVANKTDDTYELSGTNSSAYGVYREAISVTGITKAFPPVVTASGHTFAIGDDITISGVGGMTEANGHWKVGPAFAAAAKAITAITKANGAVVTVGSGHGISQNDEVIVYGVEGMSELNGNRYVVSAVGASTITLSVDTRTYRTYISGGFARKLDLTKFTLDQVDGSGWTTYTSGGTAQMTAKATVTQIAGSITVIAGTVARLVGTAYKNAVRYALAASRDFSKRV
jgi:Ubiquitin-activating enzyme E1 FCCH domain